MPHGSSNKYYDILVEVALGTKQASDLPVANDLVFEAEDRRPPSPRAKRPRTEEASPPLPPPALAPLDDKDKDGGRRHPKSHHWGPFNIIYRPASVNKHGKPTKPSWEATCPSFWHQVPRKCKKTISFAADDEDEECIAMWRVRHWCNAAPFAERSWVKHMAYHPLAVDLPEEAAMIENKLPDDWDGSDEEPGEEDKALIAAHEAAKAAAADGTADALHIHCTCTSALQAYRRSRD